MANINSLETRFGIRVGGGGGGGGGGGVCGCDRHTRTSALVAAVLGYARTLTSGS